MIEGDIRRKKIIELMSEQKEPISGSDLAKKFGVSRQVIVQDIALLRATNKNILSTNKGYFLYHPEKGTAKTKEKFLRAAYNGTDAGRIIHHCRLRWKSIRCCRGARYLRTDHRGFDALQPDGCG